MLAVLSVTKLHVEVDSLAPRGIEVADFPCLEVGRVLSPRLPAKGATIGHAVLVRLGVGFPTGRGGLAECRECGD